MAEVRDPVSTTGSPMNGVKTAKPDQMNGKQQEDHYTLPDVKTLQEAGELKIKDENDNEIQFKSLYEGKEGKQLIVFIRHFYCGHCEEYIRTLSRLLPPSTLSTTTPPTTLTIIGCGDVVCIPDYRTRTMSSLHQNNQPYYAIFSDPTRQIYSKLNMIVKMQQGDKAPEYIQGSILGNVGSSLWNIVSSGPKGLKGGNYAQNGGEWLFEGGELKWCHRMRNTRDHAEVAELKEVLGL